MVVGPERVIRFAELSLYLRDLDEGRRYAAFLAQALVDVHGILEIAQGFLGFIHVLVRNAGGQENERLLFFVVEINRDVTGAGKRIESRLGISGFVFDAARG